MADIMLNANEHKSQDLQAHHYTGKGRAAVHGSRAMKKKNTFHKDENVRSFQEAVVATKQKEYQDKIDALTENKASMEAQTSQLRDSLSAARLNQNDSILEQFKVLNEMEQKWKDRLAAAADKVAACESEWHRSAQVREERSDEDVAKNIATAQKKLDALNAKLETHREKLAYYKEKQAELESVTGMIAGVKRMHYTNRVESHASSVLKYTQECDKQQTKLQELLDDQKYAAKSKAAYQKALEDQSDLQYAYQSFDEAFAVFCAENAKNLATNMETSGLSEAELAENEEKRKYLEAYGTNAQAAIDQTQIDENQGKKDNVEAQVKRADVYNMLKSDYKGTVHAIVVDGEMFYDREQLEQEDGELEDLDKDEDAPESRVARSSEVQDQIAVDEEKVLIQEAGLIDQLEHLDVFQYINSDNLMEYMDYNEELGDFDLQSFEMPQESVPAEGGTTVEQEQKQAEMISALRKRLEDYGLDDDAIFENDPITLAGIWSAIKNGVVGGAKSGVDAGLDALGIADIMKAKESAEHDDGANTWRSAAQGGATMAALATTGLGVDALGIFSALKDVGLAANLQSVDSLKVFGLEVLGGTSASLLSGLTNAIYLGMYIGKAVDNANIAKKVTAYGQEMKKKGFNRFGRVMDNAAAENRVQKLEGITDAVGTAATTALSFTGIGGLIVTGASVILRTLIKKIGGSIIRNGTTKAIINSPAMLGSLSYDKSLINEDHFKAIFHEVTGINEPEDLGMILKVVDGIDMHRGAKASAIRPNAEIDGAMRQLGFRDPKRYKDLKLKEVFGRIGMSESNWRAVLRNAIETKGVDYNTGWTKFVKFFSSDHYKNKKVLSRQSVADERRAEGRKKAEKAAKKAAKKK